MKTALDPFPLTRANVTFHWLDRKSGANSNNNIIKYVEGTWTVESRQCFR